MYYVIDIFGIPTFLVDEDCLPKAFNTYDEAEKEAMEAFHEYKIIKI